MVEGDARFQALFEDPELETAFADLGVTETKDRREEFRRQLADSMILTWRRLDEIRSDPDVMRILSDPEVKRALEERDVVTLVQNTEFTGIIGRILEGGDSKDHKETKE